MMEDVLEASGLPVEGVREGLGRFFVYVDDGGALQGVVGLEIYGTVGLLRSVAVLASARRRGIASALIEIAVARARERDCEALYLLTLDAERYFRRFGFTAIGRDDAPAGIRGSLEFTTLCPASAVLMRRMLVA
ncbi:MAG TPA: arsenic resistance N-acetyltransferase ArsN2 [Gammaproteobacteria bacterium]|nr:arsenic resistance N-acetyltransferase ArsN2 [Gammaproteobacteria bacterium]